MITSLKKMDEEYNKNKNNEKTLKLTLINILKSLNELKDIKIDKIKKKTIIKNFKGDIKYISQIVNNLRMYEAINNEAIIDTYQKLLGVKVQGAKFKKINVNNFTSLLNNVIKTFKRSIRINNSNSMRKKMYFNERGIMRIKTIKKDDVIYNDSINVSLMNSINVSLMEISLETKDKFEKENNIVHYKTYRIKYYITDNIFFNKTLKKTLKNLYCF